MESLGKCTVDKDTRLVYVYSLYAGGHEIVAGVRTTEKEQKSKRAQEYLPESPRLVGLL